MRVSGITVRIISGSAVTLGFGLTFLDYPGVECSLDVSMLCALLSFWQTLREINEACCSLINIHTSTDSFVNTTCFIVSHGILYLLSPCLFTGTSRSIRRSWPTWTTWQESKSVTIKTKSVETFDLKSGQSDGPRCWHCIVARVSCFDINTLADQSFCWC